MQMVREQANFVRHESCPDCGSSDARSLYDDGHYFCFACEKHTPSTEPGSAAFNDNAAAPVPNENQTKRQDLLEGQFQAIPARGLTEEACRKFGYMVGTHNGEPVHIANYRDKSGNIVAQKIRTKDKRFSIVGDAKQMTLFGSHIWSKGRIAVLAEGELDACSIAQIQNLKYATFSIPNGAPAAAKAVRENWDLLMGFDSIVIMFDQDEVGRKYAEQVAEMLPVGKARIASLPMKDANEMLMAGLGHEIINSIHQAKEYRPDGIKTASDFRDLITVDETASAVTWPYSLLNDVLRGLRTSELVTVLAGSGTGKTTFCKEVMHHLMMLDQKVGIIALEEANKRTLLGLVGIHLDKNLLVERDQATDEEVLDGFDDLFTDRTCVLLDHFGSTDTDLICQRIHYMATVHGAKYILLDHISILVSANEGDERRNLDAAMTKFRSLAQALDIFVLLVSHLSRPSGDRGHEGGAAISLSQARGSHAIAQLSDACIGLQVDPDEPDSDIRQIRILKNRFTGQTGSGGTLSYNRETGRLIEEALAQLIDDDEEGDNTDDETSDDFAAQADA